MLKCLVLKAAFISVTAITLMSCGDHHSGRGQTTFKTDLSDFQKEKSPKQKLAQSIEEKESRLRQLQEDLMFAKQNFNQITKNHQQQVTSLTSSLDGNVPSDILLEVKDEVVNLQNQLENEQGNVQEIENEVEKINRLLPLMKTQIKVFELQEDQEHNQEVLATYQKENVSKDKIEKVQKKIEQNKIQLEELNPSYESDNYNL